MVILYFVEFPKHEPKILLCLEKEGVYTQIRSNQIFSLAANYDIMNNDAELLMARSHWPKANFLPPFFTNIIVKLLRTDMLATSVSISRSVNEPSQIGTAFYLTDRTFWASILKLPSYDTYNTCTLSSFIILLKHSTTSAEVSR